MSRFHNISSLRKTQKIGFSSIVERRSNELIKPQGVKLERFAYPSDPNAFLVGRERLSKGEAAYQLFATGFPTLSVSVLLFTPLGLLLYMYSKQNQPVIERRPAKSQGSLHSIFKVDPKTARLLSGSNIANLSTTKDPTLILYYNCDGSSESKLGLKIYTAIITQVSEAIGDGLRPVMINVKDSGMYLTRDLKDEIKSFGRLYVQLVIPSSPDNLVASINPVTSLEVFGNTIKELLMEYRTADSNRLLKKTWTRNGLDKSGPIPIGIEDEFTKRIRGLDKELGKIRSCLFSLELEGMECDVSDVNTLEEISKRCSETLSGV